MPPPPNKPVNKNANRPLPTPPGAAPAAKDKSAASGANKPAPPGKAGPGAAGGRGPGPAGPNAGGPGAPTGKDKKPAAVNGSAGASKSTSRNAGVAGPAKSGASASAGSASASGASGPAALGKAPIAPPKPTGGSMSANLPKPTGNTSRPLPKPPVTSGSASKTSTIPKAPKPPKSNAPTGKPEPSTYDASREKDPAFKQWQENVKHAEKAVKKYGIKPEDLKTGRK
ncbi:MAG TPA: hypothetical protein VD997_09055 [Phycisphaerales bacterium]|nr:hypothetical protein [Phycisphaerales bacterium]